MPELPEVETIVRQLRERIVEQKICAVEILRMDQWKKNDPTEVPLQMIGQTVKHIRRRAKFIIIEFQNSEQLVIHLRMTGRLTWTDQENKIGKFTRTIFHFESGEMLQFNDTRALGTLAFYDIAHRNEWQNKLGLEPLDDAWQIESFVKLCNQSALVMKDFLMDQTKVAGIGNIYANEILFLAKLHPERRVNTLDNKRIENLFTIIPEVLNLAIDKMGTSLGDGKGNFRSVYNIEGEFQKILNVYDREGEACPNCNEAIKRIKQKGRSSYFCETCQK